MNHWTFVAAAYLITLGGAGALALLSWLWMRSTEK